MEDNDNENKEKWAYLYVWSRRRVSSQGLVAGLAWALQDSKLDLADAPPHASEIG